VPSNVSVNEGQFAPVDVVVFPSDWLPIDAEGDQICTDVGLPGSTWYFLYQIIGEDGSATFGSGGSADLQLYSDNGQTPLGDGSTTSWIWCSASESVPGQFTDAFFQVFAFGDALAEGTETAGLAYFNQSTESLATANITVIDQTTGPPEITSFFASPSSILAGQSTTISWTVSNANSCTPSGGAGGWSSAIINLPNGSRPTTIGEVGSYDFTLECHNESGSDIATIEVIVREPAADLSVFSVIPSTRTLDANEPFSIRTTIDNLGLGSSEISNVLYVISDNSFISTGDPLFASATLPSLAPGATWVNEEQGTAPSEGGTYWVGVCVEVVPGETMLDNNCRDGGEITVEDAPVCLGSALSCGQEISDSLTSSDCEAGPLGLEHYARAYTLAGERGDTVWLDAFWSFDGYLLLENSSGFTVAENDNFTSSNDSHIEHTFSESGTFTVWATTFENHESGSFELLVDCQGPSGPDLLVRRPTSDATDLMPGQVVNLAASLRNPGNADSDSTNLRWVLSSDAVISLADPEISLQQSASLQPAGARTERISLAAPATPGTYWYGACADVVADESSTTNNCSEGLRIVVAETPECSSTPVSCGSMTSSRISSLDCSSGPRGAGFFAEEYTITGAAGTSLTVEADWNGFDGFLYLVGPDGLIVAENDNLTDSSDPSQSMVEYILEQDGSYSIWPTTFSRGASGNFSFDVHCGGASAPDLVTTATVLGSSELIVGEPFTIQYTVLNQGTSAADATVVAMCESNNPVISLNDTGRGTADIGSLAPGESITLEMTINAPEEPGNFWFGPCAFAVEGESLRDNNCSLPPEVFQPQSAGSGSATRMQNDIEGGLLTSVSSGAPCSDTSLSCGDSVSGSLEASDCDQSPRGSGYYSDPYTFQGSQGDVVSIDASWTDVDGYLYLQGPGGNVLVENDDFEATDQSRYEYELTRTGRYRIWPTAFSQETGGSYELELSCNQSNAPDLVTDTPVLSATQLRVEQNLTISTRARNQGDGPAQASVLRYLLSDRVNLSDSAVELGRSDVDALDGGDNSAQSVSVRLPSTAGNYYIAVCADIDALELETDNNCSVSERITLQSNNDPIDINVGLNDAWFNPNTNGQGFFINVFPNSNTMFLAWFTYDLTRPPGSVPSNLGDAGHRWRTAIGGYDRGLAQLDIELTQGGIFDASPPLTMQSMDGTMEVEFDDCNHGRITYNIPSVSRQGVIPIQRIASDNVQVCEEQIGALAGRSSLTLRSSKNQVKAGESITLNWAAAEDSVCTPKYGNDQWRRHIIDQAQDSVQLKLKTEGRYRFELSCDNGVEVSSESVDINVAQDSGASVVDINPGLNDAWYNPATDGQGFFVNIFPNSSQMFLAWFTYETSRPPAGVPFQLAEPGHRWLTAIGDYADNEAQMNIEITSGGVFDSGTPMPTQMPDGTITATFDHCNAGTMSYNIPSIGRQGEVPIERLARDTIPRCESSNSGGQDDNESLKPKDKTELANRCEGSLIWDFDWPDQEDVTLYAIQIKSPDTLASTVSDFANESSYRLQKSETIKNQHRAGWTWRYKPLFGGHKAEREWSEEFSFDVRPEESPCLD
jgi:plastocyanin